MRRRSLVGSTSRRWGFAEYEELDESPDQEYNRKLTYEQALSKGEPEVASVEVGSADRRHGLTKIGQEHCIELLCNAIA